jgi:hypothetical protein
MHKDNNPLPVKDQVEEEGAGVLVLECNRSQVMANFLVQIARKAGHG